MTITIDLEPSVEIKLRQGADAQGKPLSDYVAESLRTFTEKQMPGKISPAQSLAEMLAGRVGLFESVGLGYQTEEAAKSFSDHLAMKHNEGHL